MADFMIRFLLCNIFISIIIGILLLAKHMLKNSLTNRMNYNLWFLLLGLLAVPFLPVRLSQFLQIFSWFGSLKSTASSSDGTVMEDITVLNQPGTVNWINDFSISVSRKTPSTVGLTLCTLWGIGIFIMIVLMIKSMLRFNTIKKSALPLQNPAVRRLYYDCFPFTTGISTSMKQMQKRVINIASYHPASLRKKIYSTLSYIIIAFFLLAAAPVLSIQAVENNRYYFHEADRNISYIDLSDVFEEYDGSFVLYDAAEDSWQIYNKEYATARISPASTFKIYSALFGLESGIITPTHSLIPWDGQEYMYETRNADQTLKSAMQNSVTWYFQALDRQTGLSSIKDYIQKTGYGNQLAQGDTSSYWMNSLKISPVEQVEMLNKLYYNKFGFSPENIKAIKDSIRLYSSDNGTLSGKRGTQEVNGGNTSGWFVGYVEKNDHTYFFATNIQSKKLASGPLATELTFSILSNLKLWDA